MPNDWERRQVIALLGGIAAWPHSARAEQSLPVVGFLNAGTAQGYRRSLAAFLKGLGESGYVDGRNVKIDFRWAEGKYDRIPGFLEDFKRDGVKVIAATSTPAVFAAKAAGGTTPVVFTTSGDPVQLGLVNSLSRPNGNMTGASQLNVEVAPKRLEIMREVVPDAGAFGLLLNPDNPVAATVAKNLQATAAGFGVALHVVYAAKDQDFVPMFEKLVQVQAKGLVIGTDTFFNSRSEEIAAMAIRYRMPTIYQYPEFTEAGGLMSYGGTISESYRLAGIYTGRVLKGAKPADLPVQQVTKVELIINMKTAQSLGVTFPIPLRGRADEVIE